MGTMGLIIARAVRLSTATRRETGLLQSGDLQAAPSNRMTLLANLASSSRRPQRGKARCGARMHRIGDPRKVAFQIDRGRSGDVLQVRFS